MTSSACATSKDWTSVSSSVVLVSLLFALLWVGWMVVLVSGLVVAWSLSAALTLREGS